MADTGARLRQLREAAGLTQQQVADLVNESHGLRWLQTTVQKNEANTRPLTLPDLQALSSVFGLGLDELVNGHRCPISDQGELRAAFLMHVRHWHALSVREIDRQLAQLAPGGPDV